MATVCRRLVRPLATPTIEPQHHRKIQKLRSRLEEERIGLARWMSRLRRAFHAAEKHSSRIRRIERQITKLEE